MREDDVRDPFNDPYGGDPPPAATGSSWLPPGYTLNPDGSITGPGGKQFAPAPPPGYSRDPNTGNVVFNGLDPNSGAVTGKPTVATDPAWSNPIPAKVDPKTDQKPATPAAVSTPAVPAAASAPPPVSSAGPTPNLPTYTPPPAYEKPPAFSYDQFHAPTADDVLNDPGYKFTLDQGTQALQHSAAARGVLNTGGTLQDLVGFGQQLASTRYNDVWNRDMSAYQTNRGNALDTYNTNYGTQYKDPYTINYQSQYTDPFAFDSQNAMSTYGAQAHNTDQNQYYGFNTWLQQYQQARNSQLDAFNQRYALLSLR